MDHFEEIPPEAERVVAKRKLKKEREELAAKAKLVQAEAVSETPTAPVTLETPVAEESTPAASETPAAKVEVDSLEQLKQECPDIKELKRVYWDLEHLDRYSTSLREYIAHSPAEINRNGLTVILSESGGYFNIIVQSSELKEAITQRDKLEQGQKEAIQSMTTASGEGRKLTYWNPFKALSKWRFETKAEEQFEIQKNLGDSIPVARTRVRSLEDAVKIIQENLGRALPQSFLAKSHEIDPTQVLTHKDFVDRVIKEIGRLDRLKTDNEGYKELVARYDTLVGQK